jgi:hypothetical protein
MVGVYSSSDQKREKKNIKVGKHGGLRWLWRHKCKYEDNIEVYIWKQVVRV